jgi:hypothetical protein
VLEPGAALGWSPGPWPASRGVLRELPLLPRRAGLRLVETRAHVYAEVGTGRFFVGQAETFGPLVATTAPPR